MSKRAIVMVLALKSMLCNPLTKEKVLVMVKVQVEKGLGQ